MNRKQKQNEQKPKEKTKSAAWNADRPVVHYTRLRNLMVRRVIFADSASMLTENMAINFGKITI